MLQGKSKITNISAKLNPEEFVSAKAYILGAVHGYTASDEEGCFSVRNLFGGKNKDWGDTPLQAIYNFYRNTEKLRHEEAAKRAAQDVGKLLRQVLNEDKYDYIEQLESDPHQYHRNSAKSLHD